MFTELEAQNVGCTIVFLDVDDFKDINDTYGHQYGDELLKTVARVLEEQKPKDSMVYRFGGDEFIVFIPGNRHDTAEKYIKPCMMSWSNTACLSVTASYIQSRAVVRALMIIS